MNMRAEVSGLGNRWLRWLLAASVMALGLSACSATFQNHGYIPPPETLAELEIGASRDDVISLVGTPGAAGVMHEDAWFYTAYRVRNFAYQAPEVIERQIVAVSFDDRGRVMNVEQFGLEDGQAVTLSRRVTTSSVREVSFFNQLFSNLGRINIADALGD